MGGILSAEVALLPSTTSYNPGSEKFRHQILGTISFDCPFLGLHPGVVFSGIGSLFRSTPTSPGTQNPSSGAENQVSGVFPEENRRTSSPSLMPLNSNRSGAERDPSSSATFDIAGRRMAEAPAGSRSQESIETHPYSHPLSSDPNYDPPFPNDVRLPQRTGWDNAVHFVTKHSQNLTKAASTYVTSHLKFGVCIADYKGLKNRYTRLRALEDIRPIHNYGRRIRFLNYYTTCAGRPKEIKPAATIEQDPSDDTGSARPGRHVRDRSNPCLSALTTQPSLPSPRISVEEYRDGEVLLRETVDPDATQPEPNENPATEGSIRMSEADSTEHFMHRNNNESVSVPETSGGREPAALVLRRPDESHSLPPLPPFPERPQIYDPASYSDKKSRDLAHKRYSTEFKSYLRALKAYDKAINTRLNLLEKQDKLDDKIKKSRKSPEIENRRSPTTTVTSIKKSESVPTSTTTTENGSHNHIPSTPNKKVKKERRFCVLPPRIHGDMDQCWVQVFMRDVDEVGAHCGLFVPGDHYGWLVNDVGTKIKAWVEEM